MPDPPALIQAAFQAMVASYSPYSNFKVGAAVETSDGHVFVGTNIENASFGLSICAERVALFSAITAGHHHFRTLAVVSDSEHIVRPCGACRQVISEFGPMELWMASDTGEAMSSTIEGLLPLCFGPSDLLDRHPHRKPRVS